MFRVITLTMKGVSVRKNISKRRLHKFDNATSNATISPPSFISMQAVIDFQISIISKNFNKSFDPRLGICQWRHELPITLTRFYVLGLGVARLYRWGHIQPPALTQATLTVIFGVFGGSEQCSFRGHIKL